MRLIGESRVERDLDQRAAPVNPFPCEFPSGFLWLAFGAAVQHVLHDRRRLRIFNVAMGALLALSMVLIVR